VTVTIFRVLTPWILEIISNVSGEVLTYIFVPRIYCRKIEAASSSKALVTASRKE